jgi:hypothetical protein
MHGSRARKAAMAREWIAAWNAHDVEAVLRHYSDGAVLVSEGVKSRLGRADGLLRGKDELREYFRMGLVQDPQLHFELETVFFSPTGYAVAYRRASSRRSLDIVEWDAAAELARTIVVFDE